MSVLKPSQSVTVAPNSEVTLDFDANYFYVESSSFAFNVVRDDTYPHALEAGQGFDGVQFNKLRFVNNDASNPLVVNYVSGKNAKIVDNTSKISGSIPNRSGDAIDHGSAVVGTTAVKILDADPKRCRAHFLCTTGAVYLGKSSVNNTNTLPTVKGQTFTIDNGAEVWAVCDAAAQDLRWFTEAE